MKMVTFDTNCFIDAFNLKSHIHTAAQKIIRECRSKNIKITVSRHTLSELKEPPEAVNFVQSVEILPHYPIGKWNEQVVTWGEVAGTWDDAKRNQKIQEELETLAKSGNDIRDRGAYIDALLANADVFVTSDKQLVGSGPATRIESKFGLRVITPQQLVSEFKNT